MADYQLPPELQNLNPSRYAVVIQMIANIEREVDISKDLGENKTRRQIIDEILDYKSRLDSEPHW